MTRAPKLDEPLISARLAALGGWQREGDTIVRTFHFKNYHEVMAFVNATAWISHREDHHPDMVLGYNRCRVAYTSHDVGGLSERDFRCAMRIDALFSL